jgi:hypothetical protein
VGRDAAADAVTSSFLDADRAGLIPCEPQGANIMASTLAIRGSSLAGWSAITLFVLAGRSVGDTFPAVINLADLNGSNGFRMYGIANGDECGFSVASAGDLNGDGYDDAVIGARYANRDVTNNNSGEAYVVFGGPNVGTAGPMYLSSLDGSNGFRFRGVDLDDRAGCSVSPAGDLNHDGYADLLIGAHRAGSWIYTGGAVYVVFGGPTVGASGVIDALELDGTNGFVIRAAASGDNVGYAISRADDINGDGHDDIVIGAYGVDDGAEINVGAAYVVFGGPGIGTSGLLNLSTLDGSNGFAVLGINPGNSAGFSAAGAGDFNNDTYADIIIGAPHTTPLGRANAGEVYIVFGGPSVGSTGLVPLAGLPPAQGFAIPGVAADDRCGISVDRGGDINGDGIDDAIIGAFRAGDAPREDAGKTYALFGGPTVGASGSFDLATLNGTNGFAILGAIEHRNSGYCVRTAGDCNGDTHPDIIIGTLQWNSAYLVFGGPGVGASGLVDLAFLDGANGCTINGITPGDFAGRAVAGAGDFNGDGVDDLLIGAPEARMKFGDAFLVRGRLSTPTCTGDINNDGSTNAADFVILAGNFGASVTPHTSGDLSGDGLVNAADFVILAGDFGCGG